MRSPEPIRPEGPMLMLVHRRPTMSGCVLNESASNIAADRSTARRCVTAHVSLILLAAFLVCRTAEAACPFLNSAESTVQQWNRIAEEATVALPPNGAGAIQNEGLLYMGYTSAAVYDAVV